MYTFNTVKTIEELLTIEPQWNELLEQSFFDSLFCSHEWITCWWKNFAEGNDKMAVVTAVAEGNIVAIAPLMITSLHEYGFKYRVLRFIGVPNADRCDIIIHRNHAEVVEPLFEYLYKKVPGWQQMHLNEVPQKSVFSQWLEGKKRRVYQKNGSECPYVPLAEWTDWNEYYKSLSRKTRLDLNQKNNKLTREGNSRYIHELSPLPYSQNFSSARILEKESTKAQRIQNLALAGEQHWGFQNELLGSQKNFKAVLSFLEREGEMAGYVFGFLYKGRFYAYNTSFSSKANVYSPGKLVMKETMKYCKENEVHEFDFLRGANSLKYSLAKKSRMQKNIYYFKPSIYNLIYQLSAFTIRPIVKKIVN